MSACGNIAKESLKLWIKFTAKCSRVTLMSSSGSNDIAKRMQMPSTFWTTIQVFFILYYISLLGVYLFTNMFLKLCRLYIFLYFFSQYSSKHPIKFCFYEFLSREKGPINSIVNKCLFLIDIEGRFSLGLVSSNIVLSSSRRNPGLAPDGSPGFLLKFSSIKIHMSWQWCNYIQSYISI